MPHTPTDAEPSMIARFSLYGFLKNLRFFEAFLILALRERHMDFLAIGGLIAVREITVNLFEIPSGALADAVGRRRCMVASMACYIVAYLVLGLAEQYALLAGAMIFYGVADAFRTGTHKALIYAWLRAQGRESERTKVYGYTRSWSQVGSALSAILAGALVFMSGHYTAIFLFSVIPALVNLVNLATYPAWLDSQIPHHANKLKMGLKHLGSGLRDIVLQAPLRRLVRDSLVMEGGYAVVKDYLQPVLQHAAIALPVMLAFSDKQRTAVLGGAAYAVLYALASFASRHSHRWETWAGETERAISRLYLASTICFIVLAAALLTNHAWLAIAVFIVLGTIQNLWRPIHVGRFDRDGVEQYAVTTLSIESQAKAGAAAIWAPLIGWMIDHAAHKANPVPVTALWPITLLGIPIALTALWRMLPTNPPAAEPSEAHATSDAP